MKREEKCPVCGEVTETQYREMGYNYVAHICVECKADKKQDPKAPV